MSDRYPPETLGDEADDGTMPENVNTLRQAVVGHRIVAAEKATEGLGSSYGRPGTGLILTLDNGTKVSLADTYDCCAETVVESFLLHPDRVDHIITGVGTTDSYQRWHIFADFGDVLELEVGWSPGNPFYYGYGFSIDVYPVPDTTTDNERD